MLTVAVPATVGICVIDTVAWALVGQEACLIERSKTLEALDAQEMTVDISDFRCGQSLKGDVKFWV